MSHFRYFHQYRASKMEIHNHSLFSYCPVLFPGRFWWSREPAGEFVLNLKCLTVNPRIGIFLYPTLRAFSLKKWYKVSRLGPLGIIGWRNLMEYCCDFTSWPQLSGRRQFNHFREWFSLYIFLFDLMVFLITQLCAILISYSRRCRLKCHMRLHLNRRRYRCPDCNLSFNTTLNWKRHQTVHQGMVCLIF